MGGAEPRGLGRGKRWEAVRGLPHMQNMIETRLLQLGGWGLAAHVERDRKRAVAASATYTATTTTGHMRARPRRAPRRQIAVLRVRWLVHRRKHRGDAIGEGLPCTTLPAIRVPWTGSLAGHVAPRVVTHLFCSPHPRNSHTLLLRRHDAIMPAGVT